VGAASTTSTVTLRVVGGDEKETQCLGVQLGHPVTGGYRYGGLIFQVWGVSNLRQQNIIMSPTVLGPKNECAGEGQQRL
jgi:hypothetical protein